MTKKSFLQELNTRLEEHFAELDPELNEADLDTIVEVINTLCMAVLEGDFDAPGT
jgi:predicted house-cleaning noncanonical NTP pyrophosphatase (MazG superfamily)